MSIKAFQPSKWKTPSSQRHIGVQSTLDEMAEQRVAVFCPTCRNHKLLKLNEQKQWRHPTGKLQSCPSLLTESNAVIWSGNLNNAEFLELCLAAENAVAEEKAKQANSDANYDEFMRKFPAYASDGIRDPVAMFGFTFDKPSKRQAGKPWVQYIIRRNEEHVRVDKGQKRHSFEEAKEDLKSYLAKEGLTEAHAEKKARVLAKEMHDCTNLQAQSLVQVTPAEQCVLEARPYHWLVREKNHFHPTTGSFSKEDNQPLINAEHQHVLSEDFIFLAPGVKKEERGKNRIQSHTSFVVKNMMKMLESYPQQLVMWDLAECRGEGGVINQPSYQNSKSVFLFADVISRYEFFASMSPQLELHHYGLVDNGEYSPVQLDFNKDSQHPPFFGGQQLGIHLLKLLGISPEHYGGPILYQMNRAHSIMPLRQKARVDENEKYLRDVGDLHVSVQVRGISQLVIASQDGTQGICRVVMRPAAIWAMKNRALDIFSYGLIPGDISVEMPIPMVPDGHCTRECDMCSVTLTAQYLLKPEFKQQPAVGGGQEEKNEET